MNNDIRDCIIKEIVVEPLLRSNFEESVRYALINAIENNLNITVMHQGWPFRIVPREILRGILEQHKDEGSN